MMQSNLWRMVCMSIVLCMISAIFLNININAEAQETEQSGFVIEDGVLIRYEGSEAEVSVPEGVTVIGEEAFAGNETLETVIVPEGVTTIGKKAFAGCKKLCSVKLPDSLTSMEKYVFSKCDSLTELTLPVNLSVITNYFQESYQYYNPGGEITGTPGPWEMRFEESSIETLYILSKEAKLEDEYVYGPGILWWSEVFGAKTIYGYSGTGAQELAENGIAVFGKAEFVPLDTPETEPPVPGTEPPVPGTEPPVPGTEPPVSDAPGTEPPAPCLRGDVNADGKVAANDALCVLRFVVRLEQPVSQAQEAAADVDGDGYIMANDALEILRIVVGLAD